MKKRIFLAFLGFAILLSSCTPAAKPDGNSSMASSESSSSDTTQPDSSSPSSDENSSESDVSSDDTAEIPSWDDDPSSTVSTESEIKEEVVLEEMTAPIQKLFAISEADKKISYDANTLYRMDLKKIINEAEEAGVSEKVRYDTLVLVAAIQGIVNRNGAHFYIDYVTNTGSDYNGANPYIVEGVPSSSDPDGYWFDQLTAKGEFLSGKKVVKIESIGKLISLFRPFFNGVVVWDPAVAATSNVALTVAGVDDLLPMRYDEGLGVYDWFVRRNEILPVKRNLVGVFTGKGKIPETKLPTTGSKKCDAYIWALEKYLKPGKTNKTRMSGHVDAASESVYDVTYGNLEDQALVNIDYYIAERCFFWDLSPWPGMTPNDDPTQMPGTDYQTLCKILTAQNKLAGKEMTTVGVFAPFKTKYCDEAGMKSAPNAVQNEWQYMSLMSTYNCQVDADQAGFGSVANLSIMRQYPLKESYKQNSKEPKTTKLENKNYVVFYSADMDSSAVMGKAMVTALWNDPKRGEVPIAWSFNTNAQNRVPHVIDHLYKTKTENDYFVATDNGTGYFNASRLNPKFRPAGLNGSFADYIALAKKQLARFDIDISGLIIDTDDQDYAISQYTYGNEENVYKMVMSKELTDMYASITPVGAAFSIKPFGKKSSSGTPTVQTANPYSPAVDAAYAAWSISKDLKDPEKNGPGFLWCRMIFLPPSVAVEIKNLFDTQYAHLNIEVVDPYTFYALYNEANK